MDHHQQQPLDVCRGYLTDQQYLEHMIPHHQVAIDMSVEQAKHTSNDRLAAVMRSLIWTQQYEIDLMKQILQEPVASNVSHMAPPSASRPFVEATFTCVPPNTLELSDSFCDPHFFDPAAHAAHMGGGSGSTPTTDEAYIDHMIPHHQVAVDMSKVLLQNTDNDFMSHLAYRIIRAQEAEIKLLHDLRTDPMWVRPMALQDGLM